MKKILKILWWLVFMPILAVALAVFVTFAILHHCQYSNITISTVTTLFVNPAVFFVSILYGLKKIKKK